MNSRTTIPQFIALTITPLVCSEACTNWDSCVAIYKKCLVSLEFPFMGASGTLRLTQPCKAGAASREGPWDQVINFKSLTWHEYQVTPGMLDFKSYFVYTSKNHLALSVGLKIYWLHSLQMGCPWYDTVWSWVSSSGALVRVAYPLITIAPWFILTQIDSTC